MARIHELPGSWLSTLQHNHGWYNVKAINLLYVIFTGHVPTVSLVTVCTVLCGVVVVTLEKNET